MFKSWWAPSWLRRYRILRRQISIIFRRQEQLMNDFTALNAAVTALDAAVKALQAGANVQPQIDAVTSNVTAITTSLTPPPPAPPA